ncbi:hypothetical protein P7H16_21815 [Paenibacillus larvae]|nr:hypothetical protein [Paenibacillus larvae]MDT2241155.1 hypothetical protein [Paenibacillus larvae]MDT2249025.1 hypothetical protein [Paenibacillus larvae]MDT2287662.1 hypothetical protein [Paenibacillus larvae]MDT2294857.1 hypothetical protein [Paenibacillus larvae]MDT2305971.1 hypothetical protein [Paenibacillus larvae]
MNDTDVTYGPASGAMIIHGFIDSAKIPTPPDDATKAVLNQITFLA